jgi:hypothetical protein
MIVVANEPAPERADTARVKARRPARKRSLRSRVLLWSGIGVALLLAVGTIGNAIAPVKTTPGSESPKSSAPEMTSSTPSVTTETPTEAPTTTTTTTETTPNAAAQEGSGPLYPSPRIGDREAYFAAYKACDDGITAEGMCMCIAAKLSQRPDAATLDYPTLLDYNNPNPPWYLIDITGSCEAKIG